jgi:uncharacterized caspase-like protein/tetratricopeptide (TPR) repeat protein
VRTVPSGKDEFTARDAGEAPPRARSPVGERWAVLVGISEYQDARLTLRFAHRDAQDLYDFLLTQAGGAFAAERIELLLNGDATRDRLTKALTSFLAQTKEDDLVLIYIACHGAPDASAIGQPLYVFTHETDVDDIGGTALPMDDLAWCIRNYVRAQRVVILADTCHSEGMATGSRGADLSAGALNRYLHQFSTSKPGVAWLTSAREDQRSYEDEKWGDGHGAFTWFLLQGMQGAADGWGGRPRDNLVTLEELAAYVGDQVFKETKQRQRPVLGSGRYDPELPMAVTGGLDAAQHVSLARALLEVGWLLDDPAPFLCAAREADIGAELAALTGEALPAAATLTGESLLAAGEATRVAELLVKAIERHGETLAPETWLYLGLAQAQLFDTAGAAEALGEFSRRGSDLPDGSWAADYAAWLKSSSGGVTRALLIGVGTHAAANVPDLLGPPNDVALVSDFLKSRLGVVPDDVAALVNENATKDRIVDVVRRVREKSRPNDCFVFYFSGHAARPATAREPYLITHDAAPDGSGSGMSAVDLKELLTTIPARTRLVLLDTHGSAVLNDLIATVPGTTIVAASAPGTTAYERHGGDQTVGAFTEAFVAAWNEAGDPRRITYAELTAAAAHRIEPQFPQVPVVVGDATEMVLEGRFGAADLWRVARTRASSEMPHALVAECARNKWSRGSRIIARDYAARRVFEKALPLLRTLAKAENTASTWIELTRVAVSAGQFEEALTALTSMETLSESARWHVSTERAVHAMRALRDARARALLVGIASHADETLPKAEGAGADLDAMRDFLATQGLARPDIIELRDEEATAAAIIERFSQLVSHAQEELAVFYFAGNGSRSALGEPTIIPYDGRDGGADDLTLAALGVTARDAPNLVTIIDAACGYDSQGKGTRAAPIALESPAARDWALEPAAVAPIGAATILCEVPGHWSPPDAPIREQAFDGIKRGILTKSLLEAAVTVGLEALTYTSWANQVSAAIHHVTWELGPGVADPVLQHRTRVQTMMRELEALETAAAAAAADLATQQAARFEERNEQSPVTHLERGLALAVTGRNEHAIRALRLARNLFDDTTIYEEQLRRDPHVDLWHREARFHLGRLLHEHGEGADELNEAVASLRQAHDQAPDDLRITLHLGLAIWALVQRQSLVEAADLLSTYIAAGAPHGRADEVRAVLEQSSMPTSEGDDSTSSTIGNPDFE